VETANAGRKVLAADLNPLFEELPKEFDQLRLQLNSKLQRLNSINHKRKGQNVLFCDGSTEFVKSRFIGEADDDIFTLRDIVLYQGSEVPTCEADAFVAP
jgi:prepilin-type processing-associated H-X9-DG protein